MDVALQQEPLILLVSLDMARLLPDMCLLLLMALLQILYLEDLLPCLQSVQFPSSLRLLQLLFGFSYFVDLPDLLDLLLCLLPLLSASCRLLL